MESVSILVDVQNVYYTTRQAHGCNFDYKALALLSNIIKILNQPSLQQLPTTIQNRIGQ